MYFWAPWSHPCKQLDLVFAELAKEYSNAKFLRVAFYNHFGIASIIFIILKPSSSTAKLDDLVLVQVQAEEVSEVTDRFEVSVVPYFILLKVLGAPLIPGSYLKK